MPPRSKLLAVAGIALVALGAIAFMAWRFNAADDGDAGFALAPTTRAVAPFSMFDEARVAIDKDCKRLLIARSQAQRVQGLRDMLRLSDARMSGTSYGACVLHVAPESYVGGPLALLKTGDIVEVDVPARSINMRVPEEELARRRAAWTPPPVRYERGYGFMFTKHIQQADQGCDFDFLRTDFGAPVPEPAIY